MNSLCECSEAKCLCRGACSLPASRSIKCTTLESLCGTCADYALSSYEGAREEDPIDERLARFAQKHPQLAWYLERILAYSIARRIGLQS